VTGAPPPLPDWLLAQARPSKGAGVAPTRTAKVGKGERHDHLCDLATRLVRAGVLDSATIVRALQAEYDENCTHDPPARRTEFTGCAEWALDTKIAEREMVRAAHDRRDGGPPSPETLLVDMEDAIAHAGDPRPYRLRPIALDGYLTLLVGRRGDDKTWKALFACNAVHNGGEIGPLIATQGPALLFDWESGRHLLADRFTTMGLKHDAFPVADGSKLRLPNDIDTVRAVVEHVGARLVIFDSLRRMAPGMREDKSDDATPVMAALANLARDTSASVVVLHNRSTKPNAPDVRGSSALEDQADAVFILERVAGDPEHRTRRRLRCTKMRPDREPSPLWLSFKVKAGFMTLAEAEPFTSGTSDDGEVAAAAHEAIADRMRSLAALVSEDGGWSPKRLATALGTTQDNGTFKRACALVIESGEWVDRGKTRARLLRPSDSGQLGIPLGDGPNARNESPSGNAIYGPEDEC
jgi:hypothetical protein